MEGIPLGAEPLWMGRHKAFPITLSPPSQFYKAGRSPLGPGAFWKEFPCAPSRYGWATIGPLPIALGPPPEFYKIDCPPLGPGALWKEFPWAPGRYGWAAMGALPLALRPPPEFYKTDCRFGWAPLGRGPVRLGSLRVAVRFGSVPHGSVSGSVGFPWGRGWIRVCSVWWPGFY